MPERRPFFTAGGAPAWVTSFLSFFRCLSVISEPPDKKRTRRQDVIRTPRREHQPPGWRQSWANRLTVGMDCYEKCTEQNLSRLTRCLCAFVGRFRGAVSSREFIKPR